MSDTQVSLDQAIAPRACRAAVSCQESKLTLLTAFTISGLIIQAWAKQPMRAARDVGERNLRSGLALEITSSLPTWRKWDAGWGIHGQPLCGGRLSAEQRRRADRGAFRSAPGYDVCGRGDPVQRQAVD